MVLVDTSILIDFLREKDHKKVLLFKEVLSRKIPYGINVYIYQELLQGVISEKNYLQLKKHLDTQRFYAVRKGKESYAEAAKIYYQCRKEGYTISSSIDCLIAQTAIENNLSLLHHDSDYDRIAKVIKTLNIYEGLS